MELTTMDVPSPETRPFFKYASPKAAREILSTRTVRYSSPLTFNDPFDVQSGLHFDFDIDSLSGKIIQRLSEVATAVETPAVDPTDAWGQLVLKVREMHPTHGFPADRWRREATKLLGWLVSKIKETQQEYQRHWQEKLLPGVRVFCVSEDRDNLLMWAHYARDHKGVVFEFWSLPDEDNPLSVARPIQYGANPPPFFSEKDFLDDILSIRKLDQKSLYHRYVFCKSDHWKYEKEWRVWYPLADEAGLYDTMPIRTSEFRALYLGCQICAEDKAALLELVRKHYPSTRVYQASKSPVAYALTYTEI
jgi:hypothetical protein